MLFSFAGRALRLKGGLKSNFELVARKQERWRSEGRQE